MEIQAAESAYQALVSGRARDAIAGFTQAIESRKLPPELLANSLLNRALAHQNIGEHQLAVGDYGAAMRVDAMSPKLRAVALYNRGLSYQKLDQPALAIEDFTSALFLDIEFAQAYYGRGEVLRRSGQLLFALNDYEHALKHHHPEAYLVHYGKALTYAELQRPLQAQEALAKSIAANGDFRPARVMLAELGSGDDTATQTAEADKPKPDPVVTGSLGELGPDVVVRKASLPAPEAPPADMLGVGEQLAASSESEVAVTSSETTEAPPEDATAEKILTKLEPESESMQQAETATEETDPAVTPQLSGWMVQLSSQREEQAAWAVWKTLAGRHGKLLTGREAAVVKADLGAKGIYFRLRVHGLESQGDAQKLCSKLKSRGVSCYAGLAAS